MTTKPTIPEFLEGCEILEGVATETPSPAEIRANLIWTKGQFERAGLIVGLDENTQAFVDHRRKPAKH